MNTTKMYGMLKAKLLLPVWSEFVPEKRPLPAVAYSHITDGFAGRLLNGCKANEFDTWRVLIVAKTRSECELIQESLKGLDLASIDGYKKIEVLAKGSIPSQPDDSIYTYYVDLKTTES